MQPGCCNWCQTILKAPDDYDRRIHRLYCSHHCLEKDQLFRHWQNDEWLTYVAQKRRGNDETEDKAD